MCSRHFWGGFSDIMVFVLCWFSGLRFGRMVLCLKRHHSGVLLSKVYNVVLFLSQMLWLVVSVCSFQIPSICSLDDNPPKVGLRKNP